MADRGRPRNRTTNLSKCHNHRNRNLNASWRILVPPSEVDHNVQYYTSSRLSHQSLMASNTSFNAILRGSAPPSDVGQDVENPRAARPTHQSSMVSYPLGVSSDSPYSRIQEGQLPNLNLGRPLARTGPISEQYIPQYPRHTSGQGVEDQQQTPSNATSNAKALLHILYAPRTSVTLQDSPLAELEDTSSTSFLNAQSSASAQTVEAIEAEAFDTDQELRLMLERGKEMVRQLMERRDQE